LAGRGAAAAQAAVTVTNVTVAQTPGTKQVVVSYDVASDATNAVTVSLAVSNGTAAVSATTRSGDVGLGVTTGTGKAIVWNAGADWNGNVATLTYTVVANDGAGTPPVVPEGMVLVQGGTLPDIGNGALNVASFYIGKYEVTWGEWQTVRTWAATNTYDIGGVGGGSGNDHPVQSVNWYHVVKWCNAKSEMEGRTPVYTVGGVVYRSEQNNDVAVNAAANGYRLPTDAEWEFAARGGTQSLGYTYSGGNDLNVVGWYRDNSGGTTHTVGTKAANELGLHDMSGNVWEWCFDWYPGWEGSYRVFRGGGWGDDPYRCRVGIRSDYGPSGAYGFIGFRVVLPPGQQ
jgi:hypothetical protein